MLLGGARAPAEKPLGCFSLSFCRTGAVCASSAGLLWPERPGRGGRMDLPTGLVALWMGRPRRMSWESDSDKTGDQQDP